MRLKISFEDIKKLFNYIDKSGTGEIGYEEFTMLLEERWRGIDPVEQLKSGLANRRPNPMETKTKSELNVYGDCQTSQDVFEKLEGLSKNKIKVPVRIGDIHPKVTNKIGRSDADELLDISNKMQTIGTTTLKNSNMADVMNHSYLQKSME